MNTNQSSRGIDARWYAVDAHGAATLCTCEEDARETAAESAQMFPNSAPYTAVQLAPVSAPTSHPIPTGATGDRDWELSCDNCNGSGHVFVKHQVAERKTDVQEFKEECEACEGRGFNIAFEDIPGIAEYVKSCRADAGATGEDERKAFEAWWRRTRGLIITKQHYFELPEVYSSWEAWQARAAGDALDAAARDVLAERQRQISAEGWTAEKDDTYAKFELADAAAQYALLAAGWKHLDVWPWERSWLKPSTPRRNLVKAAALILAEIERLDRAAIAQQKGEA